MISAIIQARTGSTRLPNKVFLELSGNPLIGHIVERIRFSVRIDNIILATTINPNDDPLEVWALQNNISVFRGSEEDVLARYFHAAETYGSNIIVRITADDPFKDPIIIDRVIDELVSKSLDFAYNNNPPTFPEGLDTEVFTSEALEKAFHEAKDPFEREHVTQYLYRHPELFSQANISHSQDLSNLRWTIDTQEDFQMASRVYEELYKSGEIFLMDDILALIQRNPGIETINSHVKRSAMYNK